MCKYIYIYIYIFTHVYRSVLSTVSPNRGRSRNVLPADMGALLFMENKTVVSEDV